MERAEKPEGRSQLVTTNRVFTPEDAKRIENKRKVKSILNSTFYTIAQLVLSIYILFSDDFRHFVAAPSTDFVFYIFTVLAMIFFLVDILLWIYLYDTYLWSLLFYLDIMSFVSLFFDLGWIYLNFFNSGESDTQGAYSYGARMAVVSTRFARYVEIMRYIRLIRIQNFLKFEKFFQEVKTELKERRERKKFIKMKYEMEKVGGTSLTANERKLSLFNGQKTFYPTFDVDIYNERKAKKDTSEPLFSSSKMNSSGKRLSMNNTKRVIIIILIMIATIPVFKYYTYNPPLTAYKAELRNVYLMANQTGQTAGFVENWNQYISFFDQTDRPLISLTLYVKGSSNYTNTVSMVARNTNITEINAYIQYRPYELKIYNEPDDMTNIPVGSYFLTAVFDDTPDAGVNAGVSLLRTAFVLIVLFIFTVLFSRDANKLILGPLHEMMEKIERIQHNPCKAAKEEFELMIKMKEKKNEYWKSRELKEKEKYETSVLLNTLVKSGELLAVGFGEAGTEIIINNLNREGLSATSDGKKVFCIFGFCDIRGFADVNDILKEGIMQFVNKIAFLVHFIVDKYAGSVNKNIGDCFLLVWKFQENEVEKVFVYDDMGEEKVDLKLKTFTTENNTITARCELAVLSFIEIILAIHKSAKISTEYGENRKIKERLGEWKLSMGFGLHMGWAIEGAIGSDHKIDASYLSPNVNLASRLEAATRQFGVHLFISGQIYHNLSKDVQKLHRLIDVINAKGSKQALELYTFDMYLKNLEKIDLITDKIKEKDFTSDDFNLYMIEYRKKLNQFHDMIFREGLSTKSLYFDHPDIREVRKIFTKSFYESWEAGFKAYRDGNWPEAYNRFTETAKMIPGYIDGPSVTLSRYIADRDKKAPPGWAGVRSLTSK